MRATPPDHLHSSVRENTFDVNPWRVLFTGGMVAMAFLVLVVRLAMLQIFDIENARTKADMQSRRLVILPPPRGNIYDRNGNLLVGNRPAHNIVVDVSALQKEFDAERARVRAEDRRLRLAHEAAGQDEVRTRTPEERAELQKILRERAADVRVLAPLLVLQRHLDYLNALLGRDDTLDLREVTEHLSLASGKRLIPFSLMRDISDAEVARFIEHVPVDSPLRLTTESVRKYPYGQAAAHILGYVSRDTRAPAVPSDPGSDPDLANFLALAPNERDRKTLKRFDGQRPVSGAELRFNKEGLAGTPGYQLWTVRINGFAYQMDSAAPAVQGAGVNLSLDIDLQKAIEDSLAAHFPDNRAAVVVLDVNTGEVLACVNSPSYDPVRMSRAAYYREQVERKNEMNHALFGLYPPGSSFKPITAIAALRSGLFTPWTMRQCDSFITIGEGARAKRFVEHDGRAFGLVNVTKMLQVSSNVFCYQVGLEIGPERLAAEGKRFGLDSPTTLELGTPRGLIVPDPAWRMRQLQQGWSKGDSANTAIGQGDNRTTVVHLAAMIASIARDETRTDVTVLRSPERDPVRNPATGELLRRWKHHGEPIGLSPESRRAIVDGLVECATTGTGRMVTQGARELGIRYDLEGLTVAAKTGTAQIRRNTSTLAWTVAYAPVENPRIALAVMVEGKEDDRSLAGGKHAGPIAHLVLGEWKKLQSRPPPPAQ